MIVRLKLKVNIYQNRRFWEKIQQAEAYEYGNMFIIEL